MPLGGRLYAEPCAPSLGGSPYVVLAAVDKSSFPWEGGCMVPGREAVCPWEGGCMQCPKKNNIYQLFIAVFPP
jgi:hypothetical protein